LSTAWSNKSVIVIAIAGGCATDTCTGITGTRIVMAIGIQDAIGIELNRAIDVT
jgi:hypothetical protein